MPGQDPNTYGVKTDSGIGLPSEYGQITPEREEEKKTPISVRTRSVFTKANFNAFHDDFLIINDVILTDVPTSAIGIESKNNVFVAETLRTHAPIVTSTGTHDWIVMLSLHFPVGAQQTNKLHRLISQITKHPLVFIFNNHIRDSMNITDPSVTTMFVVESGTLRNSPDTVGDLVLDLTLHYFNHKPFSNHFWYNTRLYGYNRDNTVKVEKERSLPLVSQGYEASAYSLNYEAEKLTRDIREGVLSFSATENVPINFPSASDAWMYYADHLAELTPGVFERTSDYIGFTLRVYEHHNPPQPEQRQGAGLAEHAYNTKFTYPDYANIYNVMSAPTNPEVPKTNSMRQADLAVQTPAEVSVEAGNDQLATFTHKGRTVQIDDDTALWLARMIVGEGSKGCSYNKAATLMWCYMNRFMYKRHGWGSLKTLLTLHSQPINRRWIPGGDLWEHWKPKEDRQAAKNPDYRRKHTRENQLERRLRIRSLSWSDIPKKIRGWVNKFRQGALPVPAAVAALKRPRITDFSSKESENQYVHPHGIAFSKPRKIKRKNGTYFTKWPDWFFEEDGLRPGTLTVIPPKNSAPIGDNVTITEGFTEDDLVSDELSTQSIDPQLVNQEEPGEATYISRDVAARKEWIRNMEKHNPPLYYYELDPKLRNIFYTDMEFHVSSDPAKQNSGEALKNIVLSALSVSFGHRVVPHKLASQDTYTWQFLGAGNRSGTMVFTFAGKDGRESANKIKAVVNAARENARIFGSLIPDAGSVGIYWDDGITRERNSIMALLNIHNVVITNIKESSTSDGADKHQLVINFIVQDFAEEEYDKKLYTDSDSNRRIIKGIMDLLVVYKPKDGQWKPREEKLFGLIDGAEIRDWQRIYPNPLYVTDRLLFEREEVVKEIAHYRETGSHVGGATKPFRRDPSFPAWLAEILIKATSYCRDIDDKIPPTSWKISTETNDTWRDRYEFYGAGDKIKGRVLNIHEDERNGSISTRTGGPRARIQGAEVNWDEMYRGNFQYDGSPEGVETNELHARMFMKWLNRMKILVQEVRKNVSDEKNFEKYFGSVGKDIIEQLTSGVDVCYKDMFMPDAPGRRIALHPDFYVYDDSGEDPALLTLTDDRSMASLLEKHIENEVASIERYVKNTALGGSYLSRNLPRIITERKKNLDNFGGKNRVEEGWLGEMGFLSFSDMMREGTQAWEPTFYRPNDPVYNRDDIQKWINNVAGEFGGKGDKAKFTFMNNLIELSPYLRDGHGDLWKQPYNSAPPDYLIETLYDEDWKDLSFGPNPSYTHVDTVMMGNPPDPSTKASFERAKQREKQIMAIEDSLVTDEFSTQTIDPEAAIEGLERTQTSDGAYTVGKSFEEFEQEVRDATMVPFIEKPPAEVASDTAKTAGSSILRTLPVIGTLAGAAMDVVNFIEGLKEAKTFVTDIHGKAATKKRIDEILSDYDHPIAGIFTKDGENSKLAELATGIARGTKSKDLSIRRVYPTFRIYFIEDDEHETEKVDGKVIRAFDDFYSYSSIQEIRISRSRKVAADLAVIRMTNIGGKLLRRRFGDKPQWDAIEKAVSGEEAEHATGIFADTEKENPFETMVLQDGVKVQIRLGYSNNPDHLESVFLGSIVEIQPVEDGKLLEIVCQGFGAELEGVELGPLNDGPIYYFTQQVLSGAIIQDSIVNFGRRSKFNRFAPGEARHSFTGGDGRWTLHNLNPAALLDAWGQQKLYRHFYRYSFRNYPQDDNIYAPPPHIYTNTWERFWDNACTYRPLKQTPWQIFKEHELRHPGYISMAVPYGHSPRMTMFFGAKGQHYWSRPPSAIELFLAENASDAIIQMRGMSQEDILHPDFIDKLTKLAEKFPTLADAIARGATSLGAPISASTEMARIFGRYRPFRNYHYFDSLHHILKNTIRTNIDGTYNQVEVLYFDDEEDIEGDSEEIQNNFKALIRGDYIFSCKLDENIPEEYIRSYREEFPSCITDTMARRYAQGLFARLLRDAYKGELCVLGEPTLKPYDICFLNDTSINMTGPIEVEAVEHIINREHGFISIITPDLCVDINDFYSASVFDVMASALPSVFSDNPIATAGLAAVVCPLGFLALTGGVKFMMWMQEGSPVVVTPLTLAGKPFMSTVLGQKRASLVTSLQGQWSQYWDDLRVGWDKYDIAETIFDSRISFQEKLAGLFTADPGESLELAE